MLEENRSPASEPLSIVDEWLNVLDELLAKPLPARADGADKELPHHVDLRVSQEFWHDEPGEEDASIDFDFDADRVRLAAAITKRYGPPRRIDIRPYAQDRPHLGAAAQTALDDLLGGRTLLDYARPGWTLLNYLTDWFTEVDLWTTGERDIVLEVGQVDREFPLQLMLALVTSATPQAPRSDCAKSHSPPPLVARLDLNHRPSIPGSPIVKITGR